MIRLRALAALGGLALLTGCGLPPATIAGLAGAGGMGTGLSLGTLFGGTTAVVYPTPAQEMADIEALMKLIHQHELAVAAIQQTPVVVNLPTPVVVTPSPTPGAPPTVTPLPTTPPATGTLPPRPAGSPPPVVGNPALRIAPPLDRQSVAQSAWPRFAWERE